MHHFPASYGLKYMQRLAFPVHLCIYSVAKSTQSSLPRSKVSDVGLHIGSMDTTEGATLVSLFAEPLSYSPMSHACPSKIVCNNSTLSPLLIPLN